MASRNASSTRNPRHQTRGRGLAAPEPEGRTYSSHKDPAQASLHPPHTRCLLPWAQEPNRRGPVPRGPVVPKATLRCPEHTSLQARLQSTLQKCAFLSVSLQVITEMLLPCLPLSPHHTQAREPA